MRLFLSAHREFFSESENAARNEALKQDLENLYLRQVQDVKGCYKGVVEDSFAVIIGNSKASVGDVLELAKKYDQESVLLETMTEDCYLIYMNGNAPEMIGGMFQVDKPNENEDYSIIEGKFYVIR